MLFTGRTGWKNSGGSLTYSQGERNNVAEASHYPGWNEMEALATCEDKDFMGHAYPNLFQGPE